MKHLVGQPIIPLCTEENKHSAAVACCARGPGVMFQVDCPQSFCGREGGSPATGKNLIGSSGAAIRAGGFSVSP